jgi:hypothetical protein
VKRREINAKLRAGRRDDVNILLVCTRHIPCVIYHLFVLRQKLVQKVDAMSILVQELRFSRLWLPFLYQIQNYDWCPIT